MPPDAEPRESPSARLEEKLLKQPAQFERRAIAAVRHRGRRDVALTIDLPADNGGAARSRIAPRAGKAALSPLAGSAAPALAGDQLPAGTRAGTRRVLERDEAAAVESDDVKTTIAYALVERAAHGDGLAVAASSSEADPVGMRRRLAGIALRLERAAVVGDDVARVVDGFWRPQLDYRQLTGRTLFAPRARRPRWSSHLRIALKLREDLAQDVNHELMLGGNPLLDAPIDLSQRGRRNVDLALQRLDPLLNGVRELPTQTRHHFTSDLNS